MDITNGNRNLDTYLKSSIKWKNVLRNAKIPVLNGENITTGMVTVSPWSLSQLGISCGIQSDELIKLINSREKMKITDRVIGDDAFKVLDAEDDVDLDVPVQLLSRFMEEMDMHRLIRLIIWMNTGRIASQTGEMPTLSDSILTVKNELMVPDDFMPDYMMKLVESGVTELTSEMRDNIQGKDGLLYVICGFDQNKKAYPVSLIPSAAFSGNNLQSVYQDCLAKVREHFSEISVTEEFHNLTVSRTLRALIYQLEKNNRRELTGFLWKGEKMTILKSLNLVDESNGKPELKRDIDLPGLVSLYNHYRTEAEKLSRAWLQTKVLF